MKTSDVASLLVLSVLWSVSFLFIRVAVPAFGPVALVAVRVLIAGLLLLAWAALRGGVPPFWRRWRRYLVLGALNVAAPFTLVAAAELTVSASLASILMATIPLVTAPVAALRLRERVAARQRLGLAVGFLGVAVLVGWSPLPVDRAFVLAVAALLAAAVCYALGNVYAAGAFAGASPTDQTIGQQLAAFVLLLPFAVALPPAGVPPAGAAGAVVVLAVFSTVVAYLLYFRLLARVGPTKTATVAYLIPLSGTAAGALALGEPVGVATVVGMVVILAGVALATNARLPARSAAQPAPGVGVER